MPEKKKGAETAPEKPIDSVAQGGAEINAKIVERMVAYSPRDYLSAEDALQWDDMEKRRTAINADRDRECAAAGLKPYMPEYNAMWGSVRVAEYTDVIMAQYQLNVKALQAFYAKYCECPAELMAAFRQCAIREIVWGRDILERNLRPYGVTLADAQRILSGDCEADNDVRDICSTFSDDALCTLILEGPRCGHFVWALDYAYTSDGPLHLATLPIIRDLLPQKWTIGDPFSIPRTLIESPPLPKNQTWSIHKIEEAFSRADVINASPLQVVVANKPKIISTLSVKCDDITDELFINGHLTPYQSIVADATIALYDECTVQDRPHQITKQQIYRCLPGERDKSPAKSSLEKIDAAMKALRRLDVTYDAARELARRGVTGVPLNAPFFSFVVMPGVDRRGNEFEYYEFDREPLLLTVARITNQRISLPSKCLAVPLNMNNETYALFRYLIRRIARMNNANAKGLLQPQFTRISIDSICTHAGVTYDGTKTEKARFRKKCETMLTHWASVEFVDGWETYKNGCAVTGWEIVPRGGLKKQAPKTPRKSR